MKTPLKDIRRHPASFIPLSVPNISRKAWKYVEDCLSSGWVSSVGKYVTRFEQDLTATVGGGHAVATINGTAALHIGLLVAGVQPEDEVLMPTLTFVASANAARYCGAYPIFVDVDPKTFVMDVSKTKTFLEEQCAVHQSHLINKSTGRIVRAIMPVHFLGHPVDMDPLMELADRYKLAVVEDACESLGSAYKGRPTGRLGHVGCFSFNGNKIVTTGGGGMIVTNNKAWADRARYLTTQAKDDPKEYIHGAVGYNYRLTNIQAALGCAQLEVLPKFLKAKTLITSRYNETFKNEESVQAPIPSLWAKTNGWLYTFVLREKKRGQANQLISFLESKKIEARKLFRPMHMMPIYRQDGSALQEAERLYESAVSLPSSTNLTQREQGYVISCVKEWLDA